MAIVLRAARAQVQKRRCGWFCATRTASLAPFLVQAALGLLWVIQAIIRSMARALAIRGPSCGPACLSA